RKRHEDSIVGHVLLALPAQRVAHELSQRGGQRLARRPVGQYEDLPAQRIGLCGNGFERRFDRNAARLCSQGEGPHAFAQKGEAGIADRVGIGGDGAGDGEYSVAELDAVSEVAALEDVLTDKELEAVFGADAVELDRATRPLARQAELIPRLDLRQPAPPAPAVDRVELGQAKARDRVVPAQEEGDRVGERQDVVAPARHGYAEGLVAVARPEGPLLFGQQLTGVEREVRPTLGQRRPCGAGATDEGVYP